MLIFFQFTSASRKIQTIPPDILLVRVKNLSAGYYIKIFDWISR